MQLFIFYLIDLFDKKDIISSFDFNDSDMSVRTDAICMYKKRLAFKSSKLVVA